MPGWLTAEAVVAHVEVKGVLPSSASLVNACAAAEAWVEGTARPDLPWGDGPGYVPPADVKLGAMMLAWRLRERRSAPTGVVMTPAGAPAEFLRTDPDIARLLGVKGRFRIGAARRPNVATPTQDEIGFTSDGRPYLR